MRKNKGITLIALVITIIILIILAGITISILGGENGLLSKAKEAGRAQKIAEVKEKIGLELMSAETDAMLRGETLEVAQRDDIASKYGTVDGDTLTTTGDNYEIDLREIYNKTLSTSGSYTALKQAYETASSDLALATTSQSELATELQKTTATLNDVLSGKKAYVGGSVQEGTMTNNGAVDEEIGEGETYTIPQGYHNGLGKVTATSRTIDTNAADEGKILKDYKAYVNGELVIGSIESKTAQTYTPGTTNQTIAAGQYLEGAQTIKGDANLTAANIKKGVSIFGVTGNYFGDYEVETILNTAAQSLGSSVTTSKDYEWVIGSSATSHNDSYQMPTGISISGKSASLNISNHGPKVNSVVAEKVVVFKDVPSGTRINYSGASNNSNACLIVGLRKK